MNVQGMTKIYANMVLKCLSNIGIRYNNLSELIEELRQFRAAE
ncbi:protein of unknown function [Petrocella atlantisensis]|uniref:Uncharacterized protein n=1 Tax=Petrocella atlantisensis TaxID=2173034 RepID=A0A3P7PTX4_9FIRM|nr:hypothetical protein [Petrocella atlantisensis]VDN46691.1 protein of unknown function [Petrocella atlantisensis]